jgi:hypothetical protein
MTLPRSPRPLVVILAVAGMLSAPGLLPAQESLVGDFPKYLADREIDAGDRSLFQEGTAWNEAKQKLLIKVLARIGAPAELMLPWREAARDVAAAGAPQPLGDMLVRLRGKATFVATLTLSPEQEQLAGRGRLDLVRIRDEKGAIVDVVTKDAPRSWPRWKTIDEPAWVVGLPLATTPGPQPGPPPEGGETWPTEPPALLLAATGISWSADTPLGRLGMDYALFETVVDGRKLEATEADAFYALLAATGRAADGEIEAAAGKPGDVVPLIDPGQKWFATHRGDPLTIEGIARRATRIAVDGTARQKQVGADHYWELFVFVNTPLLAVNNRTQDSYPIVCCVRTLPAGMPSGEQISERVRISGFALKRYGYPLADLEISSSQGDVRTKGERMETALVIGKSASWVPNPSNRGASNLLFWIFSSLAALVGLALLAGAWSINRDARRAARASREQLPDRLDLPGQ